ncbi:MAG: hypothetical protein A3C30_01895 [Candidatus Levybacteria bacterium RIFCSPHIGHO2_02_FULL_40_18]|nr:MAG: hypothetical protein A2869_04275 [Candidatus Levybacteria bacterium RIFCSPHIGHO2_01_FULL_40_58]OGH26743.1 MAG: hypothetical protein A3C30_01895 [Candidatus Levybacteria bacterium RIFCSPHIGHO2_02_FULL_40_18]OGH31678.1 MAG: hypothetical protein A3E43_01615 [Candidatus Levybacteria bacterium RIFCSPHIGHO2_12_FULL_40_31]OGH40578.1 MAG: hypothetical protein A2894_00165 [Candidatus Levybacteria bacterium RIFCSPLOWO2_01_FULL_40_64]OGH48753.1 MAG: hypothetical protein A3I54_03790 [Candidatus Lev
MRYSKLFPKTIKEAPRDEVAINAKYLLRGGFIDKLMAGSYTLLPLGKRVEQKITQIIREEMNKTGAQEILMPLLHPKSIWNETGRWDKADEVMYKLKKDDKEFALSFTHEEIFLDLIRKHTSTYRDFPVKAYHFSTKFRSELRAKSGILRGREFLMKDLYSIHTSQEDLDKYYDEVRDAYLKTFERVGLSAIVAEAAGGVFTDSTTHEFQVLCETGEDEIIYCSGGDFAQNVEIAKVSEGKPCDLGHGPLKRAKVIEVGNIFRFGTSYSEKMDVSFTERSGKKQFTYLGSYGIGVTRLIGTLVELFHDDKGIIWPKEVAPFDVHLVHIEDKETEPWVRDIYKRLADSGIDVLWDDRENVSAGEKFADADLIGIPVRLIVSKKTGEGRVEWKNRDSEKTETLEVSEALKKLKS